MALQSTPIQCAVPVSIPQSQPVPQSAQQPAQAKPSEFQWGFYGPNQGGIQYEGTGIKLNVNRINPPDGLLGVHGDISQDEIGRIYGSGTYQIIKYEAGKPTLSANITISETYGPPRLPKRGGSSSTDVFGRPVDHSSPFIRERGGFVHQPPAMPVQQNRPTESLKDLVEVTTTLMDRADRKAPVPAAPQTSSSLEKVTEKLVEAATGSDWIRQWVAEQEVRRDRERREELDRWERERKEEETRWQRTVQLEQEREERIRREVQETHQRELERIRIESESRVKFESEQRATLLALEQKKTETILALEQRKTEAIQAQIRAEREALEKRMNEKVAEVEEARESIQAELEREREHDGKILELREKQLDMHAEFQKERLELLKKANDSASSENVIWGTVKELLGKVNDRIADHTDYQKLQLLVEESKKRGITVDQLSAEILSGNVVKGPGGGHVMAGAEKAPTKTNGNGNGHDGKGNGVGLIDRYFETQEFRDIVDEWAALLDAGKTPASFSNAFLTWMSADDVPSMKRAASTFHMFMSARNWAQMFAAMKPNLGKEQLKIFEKDAQRSEVFYETFRTIIDQSVEDYTERFLAARAEMKEAAAQPVQEAPVEKPEEVSQRKRVEVDSQEPTKTV